MERKEYTDYFLISVHYSDTTGEAYYEDQRDYLVITDEEAYYLLEMATDNVYPISQKSLLMLEALFE